MTRFEFQIKEKFNKKRLDEFLFDEFKSLSKASLRRVVKDGFCELNGYPTNRGTKLKTNDFLEVEIDLDKAKAIKAEKMQLDIVFEDNEIIVVNKMAGILVHPTNYERSGTLLNGLTYYLNEKSTSDFFNRPHLIHRLDKETSGLMVIAKNSKASSRLCDHFQRKLFEKTYLAIVEGVVKKDFGEINKPIGRVAIEKKWKILAEGKKAITKFKVIERFNNKTLLELEPITGRTNQLRIHCNYIGHSIVGDRMHTENEFERLCLHSSKLSFWHPKDNERMKFKSEIIFPTA